MRQPRQTTRTSPTIDDTFSFSLFIFVNWRVSEPRQYILGQWANGFSSVAVELRKCNPSEVDVVLWTAKNRKFRAIFPKQKIQWSNGSRTTILFSLGFHRQFIDNDKVCVLLVARWFVISILSVCLFAIRMLLECECSHCKCLFIPLWYINSFSLHLPPIRCESSIWLSSLKTKKNAHHDFFFRPIYITYARLSWDILVLCAVFLVCFMRCFVCADSVSGSRRLPRSLCLAAVVNLWFSDHSALDQRPFITRTFYFHSFIHMGYTHKSSDSMDAVQMQQKKGTKTIKINKKQRRIRLRRRRVRHTGTRHRDRNTNNV